MYQMPTLQLARNPGLVAMHAWVTVCNDWLNACRDLTHYRGEPDPFKGDVLNQKVRDAATETLDAIFQATDTSYSSSAKPTLTVRCNASDSIWPATHTQILATWLLYGVYVILTHRAVTKLLPYAVDSVQA